MKREELRAYVEEQRNLGIIPYHVYSTLIDGIDTLEQEPCEDAISRQEVQDLLATWLSDYLTDETREALETIDGKIGDMPSVTLKRDGMSAGLKDREEVYQQGLKDAWYAAKKLCLSPGDGGYDRGTMIGVFNDTSFSNIMSQLDLQEILKKIKDWEDKHAEDIQAGDEVIVHDGDCEYKAIVIDRDSDGALYILNENGTAEITYSRAEKTGRHRGEVVSLTKWLRGEF